MPAITLCINIFTLNLSLPVDVQEMMTPDLKSASVMVILKKCAHCRSTVPDTVWPQISVSTEGSWKPGTSVWPCPRCCAAVRTWERKIIIIELREQFDLAW